MNPFRIALVALCVVGLLLPTPASAQNCPTPITINCPDSVGGDTSSQPEARTINSTYGCIGWTLEGPEVVFSLTAPAATGDLFLDAALDHPGGWDLAIAVIEETGSGDCDTDNNCVWVEDNAGDTLEEFSGLPLTPGQTYYIIVEGYTASDSGAYTLNLSCSDCIDADGDGAYAFDAVNCPSGDDCCDDGTEGGPGCDLANAPNIYAGANEVCEDGIDQDCDGSDAICEICTDADGDGVAAFDAAICPSGTDCCDDGSEGGPGCDVANAPNINPGELELCDDTIDNDCDGADDACLGCVSDAVATCGETGTIRTQAQGAPNFDSWCGSSDTGWTGNEYIWEHTALADGGLLLEIYNRTNPAADPDIQVFASYGGGKCNPNACFGLSWWIGDVDEAAGVYGEAGETYFFSVDPYNTPDPNLNYDYTFSCLSETCAEEGTLVCGQNLVANNTNATNDLTLYDGGPAYAQLGKDVIYAFSHPIDTTVTIDSLTDAPMYLFVLENTCDPANLITHGDNFAEVDSQVVFDAAAGATYYIVGDARLPDHEGDIDITVSCSVECGALTECDYLCVDILTDTNHCNGCGNLCDLLNTDTHSCVAGTCEALTCDTGYGDCDGDATNGCETILGTPTDCADCGDLCGGATPFCSGGACTDQCPAGLDNCTGACVDLQTDLNHCGLCDNVCDLDNTDTHTCVAGLCEVVLCDTGYENCDGDHVNGCETILGTLTDCGGCADACVYANATPVCNVDTCEMGACDAGYEDCDTDTATGCEVMLGTVTDCGGCADACAFANATPVCNVDTCEMGACDADFGDCDGDPASGCETELITDANCGACGTACTLLEVCADQGAGYVCTDDCMDDDSDGYADSDCGGPDCDDADAAVNPGADEACNGADDDCDGVVDEGFDADGDGYADDGLCTGTDLDCDDTDPDVNPGAVEICGDGLDQDCNGSDLACACPDADHDGFADSACEGGTDCNDNDAHIYPGAEEECDGLDNDCDGTPDQDDTCAAGPGCDCSTNSRSPFPGAVLLFVALGMAALRRRDD